MILILSHDVVVARSSLISKNDGRILEGVYAEGRVKMAQTWFLFEQATLCALAVLFRGAPWLLVALFVALRAPSPYGPWYKRHKWQRRAISARLVFCGCCQLTLLFLLQAASQSTHLTARFGVPLPCCISRGSLWQTIHGRGRHRQHAISVLSLLSRFFIRDSSGQRV